MKNFHYFVSYNYPAGNGMCDFVFPRKIKSYDDILKLRDCISEKFDIAKNDIIILNYQLLGKYS